MKTLVTFYSRTGNTRKIGEKIAATLRADMDEIIDKKNRKGIIGWISGGRDSFRKKYTEIEAKKDPSKYDLAVVGTPIWTGSATPAIRTYLSRNKFNKIAFFCSCGGSKGKSFDEMEKLSKKPVAVLVLRQSESSDSKIKEFCAELKKN